MVKCVGCYHSNKSIDIIIEFVEEKDTSYLIVQTSEVAEGNYYGKGSCVSGIIDILSM